MIYNFIEKNGEEIYLYILDYYELNTKDPYSNLTKEKFVEKLYLQQENGQELWEKQKQAIEEQYNNYPSNNIKPYTLVVSLGLK